MKLEAAVQSQIPLEVLNPVNRLSRPVLDRGLPEEKLVFQEFIAERFTDHDALTHKNIYYLNGTVNLSHLRDSTGAHTQQRNKRWLNTILERALAN